MLLTALKVSKRIVGDSKAGRLHAYKSSVLYLFLALFLSSANSIAEGSNKQPSALKQYTINVPQKNVADALNLLAEQTGVTFLFPYKFAETQQANVVVGRFTLMEALKLLLQGSALAGGLTDSGVVIISRKKNGEGIGMNMNRKRKLLASTVAFFMGSGAGVVNAADQD